jgi:hypothetical protein
MVMRTKVIDNFLAEEDFYNLKKLIVYNAEFPFYISDSVAFPKNNERSSTEIRYWDSYIAHMIYENDVPHSDFYEMFSNIFIKKFREMEIFKSLLRIKINYYPATEEVKEHHPHVDHDFQCYGAVYSLNTCDGFTRLSDGTKIESIQNRIVFFDASKPHNSSTTSNSKGRYNINFNFI